MFHAPSIQQEIPFEFRIRYKFLSQSEAVVRYGSSSDLFDLGRVSPGTYCTRQFEECYRNKCRLQSPNYPGMYPRNVTCYWTIRQKTVPTCKHAMISVSQENSHKSLVKRSIASLNKTARTVRAWSGNQNITEKKTYSAHSLDRHLHTLKCHPLMYKVESGVRVERVDKNVLSSSHVFLSRFILIHTPI